MGKREMSGNEEQRRAQAKDARDQGKAPSEVGATTGGSQQRTKSKKGDTHQERIDLKREGKQESLRENVPEARPGSRDADTPDRERFPRR